MEQKQYIGKVVQVKITNKKENWYLAQMLNTNLLVYIEDTQDYEEQELLHKIEKCIILEERQGKLIGFLLSNRKFLNDIQKINKKRKIKKEEDNFKDIYLIERLKIKGRIMGLYLVDYEDIAKYYLDTEEIGTYYKKRKQNNMLFLENKIENELIKQIKDLVQSIDLTKKEISLRKEQEKQKRIIEKALGLEQTREIMRIATVDLKEKIEEQENNSRKKKEELEKVRIFENKKEYPKQKEVNIKQEMKLKNKVTDMKTLGKLLKDNQKLPNIEGKEFVKLGIIESSEKRNLQKVEKEQAKTNTTRYSFVAIAKDGSVSPLEIEQDFTEGNNPREINYQVTQKGEVKQDAVLSRYKIGEGTISIQNGKYGEIKVYHSPRKTIGGKGVEGNKSLDRELETDNVWSMKKEERDLAEEYGDGYRSVEEGYQEAKLHEDATKGKIEQDKMKTKDIDGDKNTQSHKHDQVNYKELAVKWGYYKKGEPNTEKAKMLLEEKRKENPKKETKEIIEMVTEDLEEQMGHNCQR